MFKCSLTLAILVVSLTICNGQDDKSKPVELEVIRASLGVWDAEFEVWPQGPDKKSMKFKGVETNRPFGKYWIASDLESKFMGQSNDVHSIIGYDLDQKKLVGKVIDQGKYSASMTGTYDQKTKTTTWITKYNNGTGKMVTQRTTMTQKSENVRVLTLNVAGKNEGEFVKMMEIKFKKRQK